MVQIAHLYFGAVKTCRCELHIVAYLYLKSISVQTDYTRNRYYHQEFVGFFFFLVEISERSKPDGIFRWFRVTKNDEKMCRPGRRDEIEDDYYKSETGGGGVLPGRLSVMPQTFTHYYFNTSRETNNNIIALVTHLERACRHIASCLKLFVKKV